ncbi:MAG TPA: PH domain-containing protein [Flavobacterium sp.]|nr:PH domain-containing protein [Flavobacterium sp.]
MTDFSKPQRQSPIGILVMFFDTVRHFAVGLWPLLVLMFIKSDEMSAFLVIGGIALLFLLITVTAYLKYLNFTFFIDEASDEFIINDGIFNKTKTVIQLDKIQQVNITQSLLQRIIGVHALDVDTAGGSEKEAKIKAVSHNLALALKAKLLENERKQPIVAQATSQPVEETQASEATPFIKISLMTLLKVGITSNYIRTVGIILAFFFSIWDNVQHFAGDDSFEHNYFDDYFAAHTIIQSALVLIIVLLVFVLVVNVLRVILRYFDFKIARQRGSLLLSFGLINTKSTIIKPEKVQIIAVTRNYFQKKMNILELKIKQASSNIKEENRNAIDIPGCNETERDAILKLLFDVIPEKGLMLKPNWRKLGFAIFLIIILPLSGFFAMASGVETRFYEFAYLVPVYVIFALLVLCFGFRNYRLFINDRFVIKQSGAWDITNEIVELHKIQAITTSQLFWHKTADIGYLTIHTAGGNIGFQLGNFTIIKKYVNLWLYEMETSDSNWM